jgi:hypothetical protein
MTDQINDFTLTKECEALAQEIFDNMLADMADDETPMDHRDTMSDRAHEAADGHEWVIYTYKAHTLCLHCNTDMGEEMLEDVGLPENPTYDSLGALIAYGEIRARIDQQIQALIDAWEPAEATTDAA